MLIEQILETYGVEIKVWAGLGLGDLWPLLHTDLLLSILPSDWILSRHSEQHQFTWVTWGDPYVHLKVSQGLCHHPSTQSPVFNQGALTGSAVTYVGD